MYIYIYIYICTDEVQSNACTKRRKTDLIKEDVSTMLCHIQTEENNQRSQKLAVAGLRQLLESASISASNIFR